MGIARTLRLENQPILSIPADRIHVLRGGQIACSRHFSEDDAAIAGEDYVGVDSRRLVILPGSTTAEYPVFIATLNEG